MIYAKRVDENQKEIVKGLRQIGASVVIVSRAAKLWDIEIFYRARAYPMEIKSTGKRHKLTPAQVELHALALRAGYEIPVVETVEEAIAVITREAHTRLPQHPEESCSMQPTN